MPQVVDVPKLAEHLGVTDRHVRRLVDERRIPYLRWGRRMRFDPDEVARFRDALGHQRTKTFDTKAAARAYLTAVEAEVSAGDWIDPTAGWYRSPSTSRPGSRRHRTSGTAPGPTLRAGFGSTSSPRSVIDPSSRSLRPTSEHGWRA